MIRSRDLAIFVTILFMLGIGIVYTIARDVTLQGRSAKEPVFNTNANEVAFTGQSDQKVLDRQQNIDRLRSALKEQTVLVQPSPSVEAPTSTEQTAAKDTQVSGVQSCGGDDSQKYIRNWPLSGVTLSEDQGLRLVTHNSDVLSSGAASTSTPVTKTTLLEMVLTPTPLTTPHCVPSDAIGVAVSGSLMFNSDASFYKGYGQDYLIGYARDGYPIYGVYQGSVDACGGYMSDSGYRYTVSQSRNYIIGCYKAQPSTFVGLE